MTSPALELVRQHRSEVAFFSAWDFHLPSEAPEHWQLIEFNDNGSGSFFAALINHYFCQLSGLGSKGSVEPPPTISAFSQRLLGMIEQEARLFFGDRGSAFFLIVDDPDSLERGKFRDEHLMLRDLLRHRGCDAGLAAPGALSWNGRDLLFQDRAVSFVVNRSTDFLWEGEAFAALRAAYQQGRVYVAPNRPAPTMMLNLAYSRTSGPC